MNDRMFLRKTCSIYASDTHFATLIFPFIRKEMEKNAQIITMLEKDETEKIEKILKNVGLDLQIKEQFKCIDWGKTNIKKIKNNFNIIEKNIENKKDINIIVLGEKIFIKKINEAIDLWFKNNLNLIEDKKTKINVINCFSFYDNNEIYNLLNTHNYILKTDGIEELERQEMLKAN